jgi:hypothetical protein
MPSSIISQSDQALTSLSIPVTVSDAALHADTVPFTAMLGRTRPTNPVLAKASKV